MIAKGAPIASPNAPSPAALAISFATFSLGSKVSETKAPAPPPAADPADAFANALRNGKLLMPTLAASLGSVNPPAAIDPKIDPATSVAILPKFGPSAYSTACLSDTTSPTCSFISVLRALPICSLSFSVGASPSISTTPKPCTLILPILFLF